MLEPVRAALVEVSAALATRDQASLRGALVRAHAVRAGSAVDEVLLQGHLFVGFPDALNAIAAWRQVSATAAPPPCGESSEAWAGRGEEVCSRVYGANYRRLRQNIAALHPDMDDWMATGGYGRVIGRPGLDLATRELCIAALLLVWNAPRQLHSHLRGALNAGATLEQVEAAVEIAAGWARPEQAAAGRELWMRIRASRTPLSD